MTIEQFEQDYKNDCISYLKQKYKITYVNISLLYRDIMLRLKSNFNIKVEYSLTTIWGEIYRIAERVILRHRNFGLTKEQFETQVLQLKKGNKIIIENIFLAHFESGMKNLMYRFSASEYDAYQAYVEAVVLIEAALKKDLIQYGNLKGYLNVIAQREYFRDKNKNSKVKLCDPKDILYETSMIPHQDTDEELIARCKKEVDSLSPLIKETIVLHFYKSMRLIDIADRLNIPVETIRKRKQRGIESLRKKVNS